MTADHGVEDALPVDSDIEVNDGGAVVGPLPVHLRLRLLAVVAVGGAFGTAARAAVDLALPAPGGVPVAILLINIVGAFGLGVLLESLARRGTDEGRRRMLRLLLGTGFAGGFTTYSTLATDTGLLLIDGRPWIAAAYAFGTLLIGALATLTGIAVAASVHRRRSPAGGGAR
jgi:CrcB protein